jgi:hypothetical protein
MVSTYLNKVTGSNHYAQHVPSQTVSHLYESNFCKSKACVSKMFAVFSSNAFRLLDDLTSSRRYLSDIAMGVRGLHLVDRAREFKIKTPSITKLFVAAATVGLAACVYWHIRG